MAFGDIIARYEKVHWPWDFVQFGIQANQRWIARPGYELEVVSHSHTQYGGTETWTSSTVLPSDSRGYPKTWKITHVGIVLYLGHEPIGNRVIFHVTHPEPRMDTFQDFTRGHHWIRFRRYIDGKPLEYPLEARNAMNDAAQELCEVGVNYDWREIGRHMIRDCFGLDIPFDSKKEFVCSSAALGFIPEMGRRAATKDHVGFEHGIDFRGYQHYGHFRRNGTIDSPWPRFGRMPDGTYRKIEHLKPADCWLLTEVERGIG